MAGREQHCLRAPTDLLRAPSALCHYIGIILPTLTLIFHLEDGGRRILKNAGNDVPDFTASRPRIILKKKPCSRPSTKSTDTPIQKGALGECALHELIIVSD
jgi:hypothetical protein